jgi:hypothetical protein
MVRRVHGKHGCVYCGDETSSLSEFVDLPVVFFNDNTKSQEERFIVIVAVAERTMVIFV